MASTDRTAQTTLILKTLAEQPYRFDFFQALRLLECVHDEKPRLGASKKASDDPIRLGQNPELTFFAASVAAFELEGGYPKNKRTTPRLATNLFGLFGPHGALPLHLTDYARSRAKQHRDPTFARFMDIFHHRMMCLFYRAWANSAPTVSYDRPQDDRFAEYIGSLVGVGTPAFCHRDALADHAKLFYSGAFSGHNKSPAALLAIISDILAVPVAFEEFVGEWMEIAPNDLTVLGQKNAVLGQSALIGSRVYGCQHKFRLKVGALSLCQYLNLLPGSTGLKQLSAIILNYVGEELVWDVNLSLKADQVPAKLALAKPVSDTAESNNTTPSAQLGWTTWLGKRQLNTPANDLTLNPLSKSSSITH